MVATLIVAEEFLLTSLNLSMKTPVNQKVRIPENHALLPQSLRLLREMLQLGYEGIDPLVQIVVTLIEGNIINVLSHLIDRNLGPSPQWQEAAPGSLTQLPAAPHQPLNCSVLQLSLYAQILLQIHVLFVLVSSVKHNNLMNHIEIISNQNNK